jgi:hypothetical protein
MMHDGDCRYGFAKQPFKTEIEMGSEFELHRPSWIQTLFRDSGNIDLG